MIMIKITCDNCGKQLYDGMDIDYAKEQIRVFTHKNGKQYCKECAELFNSDASPCPICGKVPNIERSLLSYNYVVKCMLSDDHHLSVRDPDSISAAVAKWNAFAKRVSPKEEPKGECQ